MYLVTGADGQLGLELRTLLKDSAIYVNRKELDISSEVDVRRFLELNSFDCIINCAAYTTVDKAEDEPLSAYAVNHLGAKWLAKYGRCIIHISTNYVFDGLHSKPYLENDQTNPVSVYGQSKLAGEQAVLKNAETAIIIRTAWLYSMLGNNFLKTMLRLGKERDHLNIVSDQISTPTFAGDLAEAVFRILPRMQTGKKSIYHFTNEGVCSRYEFAQAIMKIAGLSCKVNPVKSKDYPAKAIRPFYSVLNKEKIKCDFNMEIHHWHDVLVKVLGQMKDVK